MKNRKVIKKKTTRKTSKRTKIKGRKLKSKNTKKLKISPLTRSNAQTLSKSRKTSKIKKAGSPSRPVSGLFFDNLINVDTTAEVLGVAPKTIRNWISFRYIPYIKVGRRVMFRPKSLELWLNRKENKSWL